MPAKIRLQRHGKKGKPFFHIAVMDSRAKRDGRCIERLGSYNPNTDPASIHIDVDKAVDWLQKGAQPTDTARAILSHTGVRYKKHLLGGVKKGAFDEAEAQKRFDKWLREKADKINDKAKSIAEAKREAHQRRVDSKRKAGEERKAAAQAEGAESSQANPETQAKPLPKA